MRISQTIRRISTYCGWPKRLSQRDIPLGALCLPAVAVLGVIVVYPVVYALRLSLHHVELRHLSSGNAAFIGLRNYEEVLRDGLFWTSLGHTMTFTVLAVMFELLLGLGLALGRLRDLGILGQCLLCNGPGKRLELQQGRHHCDLDGLASAHEASESPVQAERGRRRDDFRPWWQLSLPLTGGRCAAWETPVAPCRLNQSPLQMGVAGVGDGNPPDSAPAEQFRGTMRGVAHGALSACGHSGAR